MRVECTNKKHIIFFIKSILKDAGEGVIIRKPNSLYEKGRSTNLFKLKVIIIN